MIRGIAFDYEPKRYPPLAVYSAVRSLYKHYQKAHVTNDTYLEAHQNLVDFIDHCGGNLAGRKTLAKYILEKKGLTSPSDDEKKAAASKAKDAYEAMAYLCGLNRDRYQDLLNQLANAFLAGQDKYPKNLVGAYNLVTN